MKNVIPFENTYSKNVALLDDYFRVSENFDVAIAIFKSNSR